MMDPHDDETPDHELLLAINAFRDMARATLHLDPRTSNAVFAAMAPHERIIIERPAKTIFGLTQKAKLAIEMYELEGNEDFMMMFCREAASGELIALAG